MSTSVSRFLLLLFVFALLLPHPAQGQGIGGSVGGVVKDESGAAVPAAVVKLINVQTGQTRTVSSDDSGRYQVREIPPGVYDVTVERPGFNTAKVERIRVSVAQVARLDDVTLSVATIGEEKVVVVTADVAMTDTSSATLSTSFSERQVQDLPILTRDVNNLALLAPGVFSVRTFSFASTLVPFAANGSRGRDNNFIIDSVDNNEPLFGGAATQFTNTDLFAEYRILTNQYKAEYGRNSGSVVNIITERGGNQWRGTVFFFGQSDEFNAANRVEGFSGLSGNTRFYETQAGGTFGGPIKKESAWFFTSYQWDRARNDLSPLYPVVATAPLTAGITALQALPPSPTLQAFLAVPSVTNLAGISSPCGSPSSNLPQLNPCTVGRPLARNSSTGAFVPINFGTFLVPRSGVFDVRDHQFSVRYDQRLGQRDDIYFRYLFDDLRTPRIIGGAPGEVGFADFGLYPEWRTSLRQRTQSLGMFWTRAWATALHELRGSFTRISSQTGAFDFVTEAVRENQPAVTVFDIFDDFALFHPRANLTTLPVVDPCSPPLNPPSARECEAVQRFLAAFPAAGSTFTMGRDSRPTRVNSNIFQLQDNFSWSRGAHSLKVGGNLVRTQTNVRQMPSDLGQYFYLSLEDFVLNDPIFAWQRFPNFKGRGGNTLPVREFAQFYFIQDDIRVGSNFTLSLGIRYENYGQAINKVMDLNPSFGPKINRDDNNLAPRIGFAWAPGRWVLRGGYGIYYNPTVFNIALIAWQSGRVSPFAVGFPSNTFPNPPFNASDVFDTNLTPNGCDVPALFGFLTSYTECTTEDRVALDLVNPFVQNWSLSLQRQFSRDFLVELSYVGSRGRDLFQRVDRNPRRGWELVDPNNCPNATVVPCLRSRLDINRGAVTEVTNGGRSIYHALQVSATHRFSRRIPLAITAAYTWSHMIDNTSEIFGPGVRFVPSADIIDLVFGQAEAQAVEAITPFAQNPNDTVRGERGNSSFDRRHRVAISFVYQMPSPESGAARFLFGNWQINGLFTAQSGQPFTPLNAVGFCRDANGDGVLTNDRPLIGNPKAPADSVAVLVSCGNPSAGYTRPGSMTIFSQAEAMQNSRFVQAPLNTLGTAGRNILTGPDIINLDFAVFKNFPWGERGNLQFRIEAYNIFNRANPGNLIGNVFTSDAQPVPAVAFGRVPSPARVTGVIPESAIDALDRSDLSGVVRPLFLSRRYMNTGSRRLQFGIKLYF